MCSEVRKLLLWENIFDNVGNYRKQKSKLLLYLGEEHSRQEKSQVQRLRCITAIEIFKNSKINVPGAEEARREW